MKRKISLLMVFCFCTFILSRAQTTFQKTCRISCGEFAYSIKQTTDGGYIICGSTYSQIADSGDIYLVKTDFIGDTLWTKTFGGASSEQAFAVKQTNDGGYIITGYTNSFGAGSSDGFLIKTDSNGNVQWTKTYGGVNGDAFYSVNETNSGEYLLLGTTNSFPFGSVGIYLVKTDNNGNVLWSKSYSDSGSGNGYDIQFTNDGGYIITGNFAFSCDATLIKTDTSGNVQWLKSYGGITDCDDGVSVQQTNDGGYIVAGSTYSFGAGHSDTYLFRTDTSGNLIWTKTFGGINEDVCYSMKQTSDGGFILTGYTNSFGAGNFDVYLLKTDSSGNLIWAKTFGEIDSDVGRSVIQTSDGGYIVTGYTSSFGACMKVYLIKTDSIGNSGCYENVLSDSITIPSTLVATPTLSIQSPTSITSIPAFSFGLGGTMHTYCFVGTNEITEVENFISIFPNPVTTEFRINTDGFKIKEVEIHDVLGNKVYENSFTETINLSDWSNGIYFVRVKSDEGIKSLKVLVQH